MKIADIYRDTATGNLNFVVREGDKVVQEETASVTDIRKLRRHIRRNFGRSIQIRGPVRKG